ncbi:MAG: amino acid ABC transporter substrate-binding protein, partial [Candidatus Eremiobacteraeota bacterium]|nr:amino acid ABC transporter substrate-binding protein [Candidatus Eremiobacteraeota bacterium]
MRGTRIAAAFVAAAFACLAPGAQTRAADGPDQIVVGAVLPLTGEESRIGGSFKLAYELATKEINDQGGVMLRAYHRKVPVKLIIYDDKTEAATSRNLYERLAVQDHVDAMLGGYSTDLVQAQTVVPNQYKIPYVNGGGAATAIYKRGFSTVYGLLASIQNLAFSECDFIEALQAQGKLPKPLKMAVVFENTSHGTDFADGLTQRAKEKPKNFQIVLKEAFDLHGKDFGPLLQKVKSSGANAFMADAHLDDYITMHRQYRQLGLKHAYLTYGARGPEKAARDALGEGVDYVAAAVWWNSQIPNAAVRAFDEKWLKAYPKSSPEWFTALPYETARTLYIALTEAGTNDKARVVDALRHIDIRDTVLPGGHIRFASDGQIRAPFVVVQNQPGGKVLIVWP